MKKHILVISQYFYPEQFRINDICNEWIKRGYKITVLTGIPNYPEGKYFKGYGLLKKRKETYQGIDIIRIPLIPRGNNKIMLILNYLSFVISGFFWKLFTSVKADLVFIFEVSPMSQALPGVWYAKKRKIPCYLYVQDLWPENIEIVAGIKNKIAIKLIGKMVDYIYKRCRTIFTTSSSFISSISKRGVPEEKIQYWPQYAEDFYKPQKRTREDEKKNHDTFNIIFAGNIGKAQGLDVLVNTAVIIKEYNLNKKIVFNIVGDGRHKDAFIEQVNKNSIQYMFNFIKKQPAIKIPGLMALNDAAFICLTDNTLFNMTIPAKLQSYMSCGIPIIASANGEIVRIINEANAGICSQAGDAKKLADNIISLFKTQKSKLEKMGINARKYSQENFNKQELLDIMDSYFK